MMFKNNKKKFIALLIVVSIVFLSTCITKTNSVAIDIRGEEYAGAAQCKNCHQQVYDDFMHAAHFNTSSDHLPEAVQVNFAPGKNRFYFNDSEDVVMEKMDSGFYQSYYKNGKKIFSQSFDIIVGSGRKAQTYLYYNDRKKIAQLPVSYYAAGNTWVNSPGFPADHPKFDRNVPSYCLGCHSSFVSVKQTYTGVVMQEEFEKNKIVYGIDCERCHGAAQAHIQYHINNPTAKEAKYITTIKTLTRVQKNDMCALCHSGFRDVQQSLFNFKPGDDLTNFYVPDYGRIDTASLDVHGNQTQLMFASKCYQLSNDLTCTSCHDVHVKERNNLAVFSQRCMNCHRQVKHSIAVTNDNCIDCHMPLKASNAINMKGQNNTDAPDYIRTHLIAVYREKK